MRRSREVSTEIRRGAPSDQSRLAATTPRIVMRKGAQGEVPPLSEIPRPIGIREDKQSAPEPSSVEPRFTVTHWDAPRGHPILTNAPRPTATLEDARSAPQREAAAARHTEALPATHVEQGDKRKWDCLIFCSELPSP